MVKLTQQQEKITLSAVLAVLTLLIIFRMATTEKPKTAPLAFPPGTVARSAVRQNHVDNPSGADPLNTFIAKRKERYPGVSRDIFKMENPAPKSKPAPVIVAPAPPPPPPPPQQTPEELAAAQSRADLAKFRFLGYLTDKDKNTVFLFQGQRAFDRKERGQFRQELPGDKCDQGLCGPARYGHAR